MAGEVTIRLLGPVGVVTRGGEATFRGHAARLLAWIALRPGRAWTTDDLADRLWPEGPPPTGRTALQNHVSRLRRALADAPGVRLESTPGGYTLHAEPGAIDLGRFTDLADQAEAERAAGRHAAAAEGLAAALGLWTGPALADVRGDPRLAAEAVRLDDQRLGAEERYAEALTDAGDLDRALAVVGRLVNDEPLRERRWALLMIALARAGRQTDALRAYRQAAATLVERTGLDPGPELQRLETAVLLQDPALDARQWRPAPGTAPAPLTALVGRDDERATVTARLAAARLVTLVGPGGVGKTTLAIAVGAAQAADFPDGVVVVDLGAGGPDDVGAAVASAVGVSSDAGGSVPVADAGGEPPETPEPRPAADPLARAGVALARRQVLVILDNCEHVADEAARAAVAVLRAGPGIRVLATSQVPLGVAGEAVVVLAPLAVPDAGAGEADVRASPAGALLARRLDDVGCPPADADDWLHAGTIVRVVDGLPLAIEIAAAAARVEPLGPLAERLARDSAAVLEAEPPAGAGRRRLSAALDAAVGRLDPEAARVYRLVSVFPAGFDASSTAAVAACGEATARAVLGRLADASLVVFEDAERRRTRLLQPVRAHAAAGLTPAERDEAERLLAAWCLTLAEGLDRSLHTPSQPDVVTRFVAELPTFRLALRRLLDAGRVTKAAELYCSLVSCWGDSPASPEAPAWGDELLTHADDLPPGPRARLEVASVHAQYAFELIAAKLPLATAACARAEGAGDRFAASCARVQMAIGLGWHATDLDRAGELLEEARTTLDADGERHWAAVALEFQGLLALRRLDLTGGIATLEASAEEHRTSGGPSDVAHALMFIGYARRATGDLTGALRAFDEARFLLAGTRVTTWLRATIGAAHAALALGRTDDAHAAFREAHDRAAEVGDRRITGTALVGLATLAERGGDDERCVALLQAAAAEALDGGDPTDGVTAAGMLASRLLAAGEPDEAAVLLGASAAVEDEVGVRVDFGLAYDDGTVRRAVAEALGDERAADLAGDGRAIGLERAVRRGVDLLLARAPAPAASRG
jgi:DNA-binding SARP family transcriptional activator/predicted ATPase